VVTGSLTSSATTNVAAIAISTAVQGPVIVDLKGYVDRGRGDSIGVGIGLFTGTGGSNSYPITVRNGSLINFGFGLWAEGYNFAVLTDITVNNLIVQLGSGQSGNGTGVKTHIIWGFRSVL
jgi:hypothetical protein